MPHRRPLLLDSPTLGLSNAIADERNHQRRRAADRKHRAPAVARSHEIVHERREKDAEVISSVHQTRAHFSSIFRPLFGDEGSAHGPLATDADARQQSEYSQLPDARRHGAQKSER